MTGEERLAPRLWVAGNANVDLLMGPVVAWPTPGTEVVVERAMWRVGGALGNTAQALLGLGVQATLVWDVGDDAMGAWLGMELAAAGTAPRRLSAPTSVTVALTHPDGERTFVSHLGHLAVSTPDAVADAVDEARAGDVLFIGGSFLLPRWQAALAAVFARAHERGVRTALDTGWPANGWDTGTRRATLALLAHVDVFLPNLEEARGLTGLDGADAGALLAALADATPGRTVIKLGRDGAAWIDGGAVATARAPTVDVVDTVGAGDTFNAALLAAMREELPWSTAIPMAVAAASLAVSTSPRRYPSWTELLEGATAPV